MWNTVGFSVRKVVNGSAYDSGLRLVWTRVRLGSVAGVAIGAGAEATVVGAAYTSFLVIMSASVSLNLGNIRGDNEDESIEGILGELRGK